MFTVIFKARPGFCNTFFAIFLIHWVLSHLISRRSYLILLMVLCYRSQLLTFFSRTMVMNNHQLKIYSLYEFLNYMLFHQQCFLYQSSVFVRRNMFQFYIFQAKLIVRILIQFNIKLIVSPLKSTGSWSSTSKKRFSIQNRLCLNEFFHVHKILYNRLSFLR